MDLVLVLTESKAELPADYKSIFHPLNKYEELLYKKLQPDWLFHLDSQVIFSSNFLDIFRCGAVNAHPGILPNYAGLFPYQWAIRNDEIEAGATLHWITEDLESGPIALQEIFKISDEDTGLSVYQKSHLGCLSVIQKALRTIDRDEKLPIIPQDKFKRKYYSLSDSVASEIDWSGSARRVFNFIRAGNFFPENSPSYTAKTHFKQATFPLQKVKLGTRALGVSGMVSSLKNGIHVVCGDGFTVILPEDTEVPPLKVGDILG